MNRNWDKIQNLGTLAGRRTIPRLFEPLGDSIGCAETDGAIPNFDYMFTKTTFAERNAKKAKDEKCDSNGQKRISCGSAKALRLREVDLSSHSKQNPSGAISSADISDISTSSLPEYNPKGEKCTSQKSEQCASLPTASESSVPVNTTQKSGVGLTSSKSPSSPLESDGPESRGWVDETYLYRKGNNILVRQRDSLGWFAYQCRPSPVYLCSSGVFGAGTAQYFPDWREIDELLFETEPMERDGFNTLHSGIWHSEMRCVGLVIGGWAADGVDGVFKSWPLLKRAMRKVGILK